MKLRALVVLIGVCLIFIPMKVDANIDSIDKIDFYDSYLTLLNPYVYNIIAEKAGPDRSYDLFNAKILNVTRNIPGITAEEKEYNKGVYDFTVTVQYRTYIGETLTLRVTPGGVKLINYEHQDV